MDVEAHDTAAGPAAVLGVGRVFQREHTHQPRRALAVEVN